MKFPTEETAESVHSLKDSDLLHRCGRAYSCVSCTPSP